MMLTHLSLQKAPALHKQMPHAPTNEDRYRELRIALAMRDLPRHNTVAWNFPRTPYGSQSGANPGPSNPAGCQPDPDDSRDWDGRPLTYAELSRGW